MAKGTWVEASEDDPIYKEGVTISSGNLPQRSTKLKKHSADDTAGHSTLTSTNPSDGPPTDEDQSGKGE